MLGADAFTLSLAHVPFEDLQAVAPDLPTGVVLILADKDFVLWAVNVTVVCKRILRRFDDWSISYPSVEHERALWVLNVPAIASHEPVDLKELWRVHPPF